MTATLSDLPTPVEAWHYLNQDRGLRHAHPTMNVRLKSNGVHLYVIARVPKRKTDGKPSKLNRLIYGNPMRTADEAIIDAALAVKHYMAVTFEGADG